MANRHRLNLNSSWMVEFKSRNSQIVRESKFLQFFSMNFSAFVSKYF